MSRYNPDASPTPTFGNIPLRNAIIAWTPKHGANQGAPDENPGKIIILPNTDAGIDELLRLNLTHSSGACWSDWLEMHGNERLLRLYMKAWHIIARDGVPPEDVHAALIVIPEYRDSLSWEPFFAWPHDHQTLSAERPADSQRRIVSDPRTFPHFPPNAKCPICGTNDDGKTVLVQISGTAKDGIVEGKPMHLACAVAKQWHEAMRLAITWPNSVNAAPVDATTEPINIAADARATTDPHSDN